jgi:hypothetical protein
MGSRMSGRDGKSWLFYLRGRSLSIQANTNDGNFKGGNVNNGGQAVMYLSERIFSEYNTLTSRTFSAEQPLLDLDSSHPYWLPKRRLTHSQHQI